MIRLLCRIIMKIGSIPNKCRIRYYRTYISGRGYRLSDEVKMYYPSNISIGEGTYINGGHIIASANAHITIGSNCLLSYNVHLRTDTHRYEDRDTLICKQGYIERSIIGNDVWIGYGAQIMPGVTIGEGCVIGAGAIVTKSTEPYSVYVGVPAKMIRQRINKRN